MEPLTKQDILLVKSLKNRKYTNNTMNSKPTPQEQVAFKNVRYKPRARHSIREIGCESGSRSS